MGDSDIPDFTNDDSYRRATDFVVPDDNLTARGTAKSYRKTPYHSRVAGLDYQDTNEIEYLVDGPRQELFNYKTVTDHENHCLSRYYLMCLPKKCSQNYVFVK